MSSEIGEYCDEEHPEFDSCKETYTTDYYTCLGMMDCTERYETVC